MNDRFENLFASIWLLFAAFGTRNLSTLTNADSPAFTTKATLLNNCKTFMGTFLAFLTLSAIIPRNYNNNKFLKALHLILVVMLCVDLDPFFLLSFTIFHIYILTKDKCVKEFTTFEKVHQTITAVLIMTLFHLEIMSIDANPGVFPNSFD
jgi:hypothetical protein